MRVGGTARKSLRMLQQLCGEDRLQNIIIVTTWWGNVTKEIGDSREQQLGTSEALFKPLLDGGAQMVRYTDTFESAHDILGRVLRNQPSALRIQEELVDEGKDILETAAGIELARELALQAQRHKEELERIKEEMEEALSQKDVQSQKELEEAERDFEARMQKALHDRQTLSLEYSKKRDAELARKPSNDYVRATPSTERAEADVPLQLNPGNRQSSRPSTPNRSRWSRWPPWLKSLLPMLRKCFCLE